MATYKLKKTDKTDLGVPVYEITVSFTKDKKKYSHKSEMSFPSKGLKKSAQTYADETEKVFRPVEKAPAEKG